MYGLTTELLSAEEDWDTVDLGRGGRSAEYKYDGQSKYRGKYDSI